MKTDEYTYGSRYRLMELIKSGGIDTLLESVPSVKVIKGTSAPSIDTQAEKTLESFLRERDLYSEKFNDWWIKRRGKRPTWDYLCEAELGNERGLILLEAKAHKSECSSGKKAKPAVGVPNYEDKLDNHMSIELSITKELAKLGGEYTGQYQIANRIAYASFAQRVLHKPVLLVFLGFIGEAPAAFPDRFESVGDWEREMERHLDALQLGSIKQENPVTFGGSKPTVVVLSSNI